MAPPTPTPREEARLRRMVENRVLLFLLAAVLATAACRSGLNPPGGYWHADEAGHVAGEPVLRYKSERCFAYFKAFNAMTFFTSLLLMLLVSSEIFYGTRPKMTAVLLIAMFDLGFFLAAYVFGTIIPNVATK